MYVTLPILIQTVFQMANRIILFLSEYDVFNLTKELLLVSTKIKLDKAEIRDKETAIHFVDPQMIALGF